MTYIINKNRRKAAIFLLLLFLVFSFISYKQEADAIAPVLAAVGVAGLAVAAYALVSYGVVFASTGDAQRASNELYTQFKDNFDSIVTTGKLAMDVASGGYTYIMRLPGELAPQIKAWVDEHFNVGENYSEETEESNTLLDTYYQMQSNGSVCGEVRLSGSQFWKYTIENGNLFYRRYYDSQYSELMSQQGYYVGTENISYQITYRNETSNTVKFYKVINGEYTLITNNDVYNQDAIIHTGIAQSTLIGIGQEGIVDNPTYDWNNSKTGEKDIGVDLVGVPNVEDADFKYRDATGDLVGLDIPDNVIDDVVDKTAEDVINDSLADTEVVDHSTDLTEEGTTDYPGDTTTTEETNTNLKFLLFSKFPFCLPWDIYNGIKLLSANPVAPRWTVDLLAPLGTEWVGKAVIDINMADYETVGTIIRWVETVGFAYMLILATRKLIWG